MKSCSQKMNVTVNGLEGIDLASKYVTFTRRIYWAYWNNIFPVTILLLLPFYFLFFNFFYALTESVRNLEYKWLKPSLQYVPNVYFTFEIFIMHTKKAIIHISSHNLKQAIAYSSVDLIDYIAFLTIYYILACPGETL